MLRHWFTRSVAAVSVLAVLALAGCSSSTPKPAEPAPSTAPAPAPAAPAAPAPTPKGNAIINIGLNADPPKLDPHLSTALVDRQVFQSIFDKLVDFDPKLNIVPMLAEKWDVSSDGKSYTFYLRKGVKFHDGTDFNADAVKYNFDRMLDKSMNSPRVSEIGKIDKYTVVDPYTFKVDLKEPFAGFLAAMADRAGMIVSPTAAKAAGMDFMNNPVGTGPFVFKSRVKGDSITLARNENYWQKDLPKAAGIVYKTVTDENVKLVNLQAGQLDIIDTVPAKQVPTLKSDNRVKVVIGPSLQHQGLWLNTKTGPTANKAVRQAISMGIDRKALVDVVFGEVALPGNSPFTPGTFTNDGTPVPARDVAGAKKVLADAGLSNVTVKFKVSNTPVNQQIGQVIQSMLAEVGIKVELQVEEFGTILTELDKKDFEMAQVGWSGRADPDGNIYAFYVTGGGNNYAGYSNPDVDKQLNDARLLTDMNQRKTIYSNIMKTIWNDVPYVYLWWPQDVKGLGPKVQGYTPVADVMIRTVNLTK